MGYPAFQSPAHLRKIPGKLVAELWKCNLGRGATVLQQLEVIGVDHTASQVQLQTRDGPVITARHAVFCTGYGLMKFATPSGYKVISTSVLATKPQSKLL